MPSLKEVKTRIASVNSTRKITSAMKMVASAKLHKAQQAIGSMLPYEKGLNRIMASFLSGATGDISSPYSTICPVCLCLWKEGRRVHKKGAWPSHRNEE